MPTNNYSDNSFDDQAPLDDEQLWDLLSLYVDGEADPEQAAIVEQMLSSDPAYRRDFDFLMASSKTMHMVEEVEPPASLRETVRAKTSRRPTLVSRLRAAWNRATTPASPAFGRYATVGGAFAVAAIGAVIFWPHQNSISGTGAPRTTVAITNTPRTTVAENTTPNTIMSPLFIFPPIKPGKDIEPRPPFHPREIVPPSPQLTTGGNLLKATKETKKRAMVNNTPHNYPLPKNDNLDSGKPELAPYPYDKKMDVASARPTTGTIIAPNVSDFGPRVTTNDDPPTPTPQTQPNPENDTHGNTGSNGTEGGNVTPAPTPKSHIRVAAMPPRDQQVLAEAMLRKTPNMRLDNFDHSLADSGRHVTSLILLKSSF